MKKRNALRMFIAVLSVATLSLPGFCAGEDLQKLIDSYPAENTETLYKNCEQLWQMGPGTLNELCGKLTPASQTDDVNVRYAISGLTKYFQQFFENSGRLDYAKILLGALEAADNTEVKTFLLEQLLMFVEMDQVLQL